MTLSIKEKFKAIIILILVLFGILYLESMMFLRQQSLAFDYVNEEISVLLITNDIQGLVRTIDSQKVFLANQENADTALVEKSFQEIKVLIEKTDSTEWSQYFNELSILADDYQAQLLIVAAGKFSWVDADNQLRPAHEALSENLNKLVLDLKSHSAISVENENNLRQKLFAALILSAVLGLLMMYAVLRLVIIKLVKPIQALSQAVEKVKRGDFQVRFSSDEKDEISQVGFAFNEMVKTLRQSQEKLRTRSTELEDSVRQLQSLNKILVGRELKMVELKEKIKVASGKISRKRGSGKVKKSD